MSPPEAFSVAGLSARGGSALGHADGHADRAARWLLGAALLVGLLRFVRLGRWSLWFDEAATWTDIHVGIEGGEISNRLGYRAIEALVAALGGAPDEFKLRLLPAIVGWCAIPLTWWAFRPFAGSRRAAAAALLVAASSWHIYWSQNARFYTMAQVVALVGGALVLRSLASGRVWLTLAGVCIAALAALFHPSAGLLVPALMIAPWIAHVCGFKLSAAKKPLLVLSAIALIGLLCSAGWISTTIGNYLRQKPGGNPQHFILTCGFYITPLLASAAVVGACVAWLRRDAFHVLLLWIIVVVLLAGLAISFFARMSAQYIFFVLPWVALLACVPIGPAPAESADPALPRGAALARGLTWMWLALLLMPLLATSALYFTVRQGERPQWREAYQYVWSRREPDDLVLGMEATVGEFYVAPQRTDLRAPLHVSWLDKWRAHVPEKWARHSRRTWYLLNPEQLFDWKAEDAAAFEAFLREQCRLIKCFPLYVESRDLSVWIYVRD